MTTILEEWHFGVCKLVDPLHFISWPPDPFLQNVLNVLQLVSLFQTIPKIMEKTFFFPLNAFYHLLKFYAYYTLYMHFKLNILKTQSSKMY